MPPPPPPSPDIEPEGFLSAAGWTGINRQKEMWGVIGGVVKRGCGRSAGKALRGASSAPLRHAALVLQTSIRCYHASKVRWSSLDGLRKPREAAQGSVDASALPELMRQLALDPANAELHFRVGLEYHRLTEAAPALEAFQRAVDLSPSHWPYLFHLATLQQECGMSDRAIKTFEAALRIDAERPESFSSTPSHAPGVPARLFLFSTSNDLLYLY